MPTQQQIKILMLFLALVVITIPFTKIARAEDWELRKLQRAYQQEIEETRSSRLQAHLTKTTNVGGSKKVIEAVVETKPTAPKVGGAMMKRIIASPGGAAIGVYAVTQLIEGIGWVMEDGTYVKKIPTNTDEGYDPNYVWRTNTVDTTEANSPAASCELAYQIYSRPISTTVYKTVNQDEYGNWYCPSPQFGRTSRGAHITRHPNPNPEQQPEEESVPLTPALLGAAMMGQGYTDPDPNFNNDTVNTDNWTGVPEAYTPDPSGKGNELADSLEDKADRAPKTPDGKAAPLGDSKYDKPLTDADDNANDRQWDGEEGTEGETDSTEKTDPETGEKTTEGTFKLPKFCDWAMTVCEWYEAWKKTDVKVNQHIDDTKQHQTEEKSFWQSVKDWFTWTKEDPELEDEPLEIEEQEIIDYEHVNYVQFGSSCPFSPSLVSLPMGILGSMEFEQDLTFICDFGGEARPYVIGLGHLGALIFLLIGIRNGNG